MRTRSPLTVVCGGDELDEYAAGRLPLDREWAWDRHLITCLVCCAGVEAAHRFRRELIETPAMRSDLQSSLLALAGESSGPRVAQGRPVTLLAPRVAVLDPGAPACHRSARRSIALATAAAGVSAAAVWSLAGIASPLGGAPSGPAGGGGSSRAEVVAPAGTTGRAGTAFLSVPLASGVTDRVAGPPDDRGQSTP